MLLLLLLSINRIVQTIKHAAQLGISQLQTEGFTALLGNAETQQERLHKEFKPNSVDLEANPLQDSVESFYCSFAGACGCRFFRFLVDPKLLKP